MIREVGLCHMRVLEGLDSFMQTSALICKVCLPAALRKKRAAVHGGGAAAGSQR